MDAEFEELVRKGKKTRQDAESMIQLANEVQYAILTKKLKPGTINPLLYYDCVSLSPIFHSDANLLQQNCFPAAWRC
jgi:hypothetical protein